MNTQHIIQRATGSFITTCLLILVPGDLPRVCADHEPPAALPAYIEVVMNSSLSDQNRIDAIRAIANLGERGKPAARSFCNLLFNDSSGEIQRACIEALKAVHPKLSEHIVTLRIDKKYQNVFDAVRAIAEMGPEANAAVPALYSNLKLNLAVSSKLEDINPDHLRYDLNKPLVVPLLQDLSAIDRAVGNLGLTRARSGSQFTEAGRAMIIACADAIAIARIAPDEEPTAEKVAEIMLYAKRSNIIKFCGLAAVCLFEEHAVGASLEVRQLQLDGDKSIRELAELAERKIFKRD